MARDVVLVPGAYRHVLLTAEPSSLQLQNADECGWEALSGEDDLWLVDFIMGHYEGYPHKSWLVSVGTRFGFDETGVFIQRDHTKRFFGIFREQASAEMLSASEAVSRTSALDRKVMRVSEISDEYRMKFLRATFKAPHAGSIGLERLVISASTVTSDASQGGNQIQILMDKVDKDDSDSIDYDEFCSWMQSHVDVASALQRALATEADLVRICFRMWDANGDGLISRREIVAVFQDSFPHFSKKELDMLVLLLDADKDGQVNYDDFVDFLLRGESS